MPVEVIGIDHVYVTVRELARSQRFYDGVMRALGYRRVESVIGGDPHVHYYNRQFGFSLRPARPGTPAHDPYAPGMHHFCFRVVDEAAVDRACSELRALGVAATDPEAVSGILARLLRHVLRGPRRSPARDHELPRGPAPPHVRLGQRLARGCRSHALRSETAARACMVGRRHDDPGPDRAGLHVREDRHRSRGARERVHQARAHAARRARVPALLRSGLRAPARPAARRLAAALDDASGSCSGGSATDRNANSCRSPAHARTAAGPSRSICPNALPAIQRCKGCGSFLKLDPPRRLTRKAEHSATVAFDDER